MCHYKIKGYQIRKRTEVHVAKTVCLMSAGINLGIWTFLAAGQLPARCFIHPVPLLLCIKRAEMFTIDYISYSSKQVVLRLWSNSIKGKESHFFIFETEDVGLCGTVLGNLIYHQAYKTSFNNLPDAHYLSLNQV